ncbi:hypothetical protein VNO78_06863 [Psophocarpus tetragonolobus]|uniref:Uncharacterized protein n=1 Tax=Psophocarpus tetragonolobus TaxID=3891 RepID=A0AAN9XRT7_PSOTE
MVPEPRHRPLPLAHNSSTNQHSAFDRLLVATTLDTHAHTCQPCLSLSLSATREPPRVTTRALFSLLAPSPFYSNQTKTTFKFQSLSLSLSLSLFKPFSLSFFSSSSSIRGVSFECESLQRRRFLCGIF